MASTEQAIAPAPLPLAGDKNVAATPPGGRAGRKWVESPAALLRHGNELFDGTCTNFFAKKFVQVPSNNSFTDK